MIIQSKYSHWNFRLCCECGTLIDSNPANMCVACLRNHVDITEGLFQPKTNKCDPFYELQVPETISNCFNYGSCHPD